MERTRGGGGIDRSVTSAYWSAVAPLPSSSPLLRGTTLSRPPSGPPSSFPSPSPSPGRARHSLHSGYSALVHTPAVGSSPLPVPLRRRRLHRHGGAPATDTETTNCAKWSPPSARCGRRPRTLCSHMPASLAELTVTDGRPMSSVVLFSPSSASFPSSRLLRCVSSPRFRLRSVYQSSEAQFTADVIDSV